MAEKKTCFVIAPIGEPDSETRRRSDQILKHVITPAAKQCGYEPIRADQISKPGIITSQVVEHVVHDELVIADLTGRNPNVFYELSIRHVLQEPFIQMIQKGEQIPFDLYGMRTIPIDHQDLDSVEEAKQDIVDQIHSLENGTGEIDTPISVALDLASLKRSDDPERRSLADLMNVVSDLRQRFQELQETLERRGRITPEYLEYLLRRPAVAVELPTGVSINLRSLAQALRIGLEGLLPNEQLEDSIGMARQLEELLNEAAYRSIRPPDRRP